MDSAGDELRPPNKLINHRFQQNRIDFNILMSVQPEGSKMRLSPGLSPSTFSSPSHRLATVLPEQVSEMGYFPEETPISFKQIHGRSHLFVYLVRLPDEPGNRKVFASDVFHFKKDPKSWGKLYFNKREFKNRSKTSSFLKLFFSEYALKYTGPLKEGGFRGSTVISIPIRDIKTVSSVGNDRICFGCILDQQGKDVSKLTFSFKFKANRDGFLNIFGRLHEHIINPQVGRRIEYNSNTNRIIPKNKDYEKALQKSYGGKPENILTKPYREWKRPDFRTWLSGLPYRLEIDPKKKGNKIISILSVLKMKRKPYPSFWRYLKEYLFEKNEIMKKNIDLREKLREKEFLDIIGHPFKDNKSKMKEFREITIILRKYFDVLEGLGTWSLPFQKVLGKMMENSLVEAREGEMAVPGLKIYEEEEEEESKKDLNDKEIGKEKNLSKAPFVDMGKALHILLDKMMSEKLILWDADELRDHILALMFFNRPFIDYEPGFENSDPSETFGQYTTKRFKKEVKKYVKEVKNSLSSFLSKTNKTIEEENEGESEDEKEMTNKTTWDRLKLLFEAKKSEVDIFSGDEDGDEIQRFFELNDDEDEVSRMKDFFIDEEKFWREIINYAISPNETLRLKDHIIRDKWGFELEKIDYNFYSKVSSLKPACPIWVSLKNKKQIVVEILDTMKENEEEKRRYEEEEKKKLNSVDNDDEEEVENKSTEEKDDDDIEIDFDMSKLDEMVDGYGLSDDMDDLLNDSDDDEKVEKTEEDPKPSEVIIDEPSPSKLEQKKSTESNETLFINLKTTIKQIQEELEEIINVIQLNEPKLNRWEFLRSASRRKEIHQLLSNEILRLMKEQGTFEIVVKLVIGELECFNDPDKVKHYGLERKVLNFIHKNIYNLNFYKYGFIHSSFMLKNVQFHWFGNQFVNIKNVVVGKYDPPNEFFCVDCYCPLIPTEYDMFQMVDNLSQKCICFNAFTPYDTHQVNSSGLSGKNCVQVTDMLLESLEVCRFHNTVKKYLGDIKKTIDKKFKLRKKRFQLTQKLIKQKLEEEEDEEQKKKGKKESKKKKNKKSKKKDDKSFEDPSLRFLDLSWKECSEFSNDERFQKVIENCHFENMKKRKKIVFRSHKEIDDFYLNLLSIDGAFSHDFPNVFEVLKGIDRGFWLLFNKTKAKKKERKEGEDVIFHGLEYKSLKRTDHEDGCPFNKSEEEEKKKGL